MYDFSIFTAQQKQALQAIVNKYASIEGSYESTMLDGIVHGYCDSGITTDAFSVNDAELVNKCFTEEAQYEGFLELYNNFIKAVTGSDLQCMQAIKEIEAACGCIENGAAYIGKLMGTIECYTE